MFVMLVFIFLVVQDDEGAGTKCSLFWYSYLSWCRMVKGQGRSVRLCGIHIFGGGGNEEVGAKCSSLWYLYFLWCRMMKGQRRSVRY